MSKKTFIALLDIERKSMFKSFFVTNQKNNSSETNDNATTNNFS